MALAQASTQGEKVLPNEFRKSFPFVLACYVLDSEDLRRDAFEHTLNLLDGHVFVWAWWLHLYHLPLRQKPESGIALRHHIEVGLSATAQVKRKQKVAVSNRERCIPMI